MKRPHEDQLLDEILADDDSTNFRQASLAHTLAKMRRTRRLRHAASLCGIAILTALLAAQLVLVPKSRRLATQSPIVSPIPAPAPAAIADQKIKFINDEELFALFPNRSLALVGKPGHQQLIFLDAPNHHPDNSL